MDLPNEVATDGDATSMLIDLLTSDNSLASTTWDVRPSLLPIFFEKLRLERGKINLRVTVSLNLTGEKCCCTSSRTLEVCIRQPQAANKLLCQRAYRVALLTLSHHGKIMGYRVGRCLYLSINKTFHWLSMIMNCYAVSRNCISYACSRVTLQKKQKIIGLFPDKEYMAFDSMRILEALRTISRNKK